MTEETTITEKEREELAGLLGYGGSVPDGKHNVHSFLHNVVTAADTTRLGNITDQELGNLSNTIRAYKFLALFSKDVMGKENLSKFFDGSSEIGTATSLSRKGFLTKLAVVQRKELADLSPEKSEKKPNKGWWKSKENKGDSENTS